MPDIFNFHIFSVSCPKNMEPNLFKDLTSFVEVTNIYIYIYIFFFSALKINKNKNKNKSNSSLHKTEELHHIAV